MSDIYNYLRDGGMFIRIKPIITNCETIKTFPAFDVGLKHLLTVINGSGGGKYTSGELIQIIANSVQGYYFHNWTDPSLVVTNTNNGTTTVNMPFADCIITATFLPYRTLTVNNGTGSNSQLKPNDIIAITANAAPQNYVFSSWSGDTAYLTNINSANTNITMPDANISVTANYVLGLVFDNVTRGYYYNGYAAKDSRNLANIGWRVPTKSDLDILVNAYGGYSVAGEHLKQTGTTTWTATNLADNSSGFTALGIGYRFNNFQGLGTITIIYSQTPIGASTEDLYSISLTNNSGFLGSSTNWICLAGSIRLIKEDSNDVGFYTGNDGKNYHTVKIGDQVWTLVNIAETKWRTGELINTTSSWNTRGVASARCSYLDNDTNM